MKVALYCYECGALYPNDGMRRVCCPDNKQSLIAQEIAAQARDGFRASLGKPIDMIIHCPSCGQQHIDEPSEWWSNPPHYSHLCKHCGIIFRTANIATNGVKAITTRGQNDTWP